MFSSQPKKIFDSSQKINPPPKRGACVCLAEVEGVDVASCALFLECSHLHNLFRVDALTTLFASDEVAVE